MFSQSRLSPEIYERDYSQKKTKSINSYLLVEENTLEKIRYLGFQKYSRKNRPLHNLNKNIKQGKENQMNRNITQRSNAFSFFDINVTILDTLRLKKIVLFNIPAS